MECWEDVPRREVQRMSYSSLGRSRDDGCNYRMDENELRCRSVVDRQLSQRARRERAVEGRVWF